MYSQMTFNLWQSTTCQKSTLWTPLRAGSRSNTPMHFEFDSMLPSHTNNASDDVNCLPWNAVHSRKTTPYRTNWIRPSQNGGPGTGIERRSQCTKTETDHQSGNSKRRSRGIKTTVQCWSWDTKTKTEHWSCSLKHRSWGMKTTTQHQRQGTKRKTKRQNRDT